MRYTSVDELPEQMRDQAQRQLNGLPPARVQIVADSAKTSPPAKPSRRSKFNAERIFKDDQWFDSKLEFRCYAWLKWRRVGGEIAFFTRQVPFILEGGVVYKLDYLAILADAPRPPFYEAWDSKGLDLQASINKRKQVWSRYKVRVGLWPKDATSTSLDPRLLARAQGL